MSLGHRVSTPKHLRAPVYVAERIRVVLPRRRYYSFDQAAGKPYMHERAAWDRVWRRFRCWLLGHSRAVGSFGPTQLCGRCQRNIGV